MKQAQLSVVIGALLAGLATLLGAPRLAGATEPNVTICHFPPGNPTNVQVITVGQSAVPAHVARHNDAVCPAGDRDCCFGGSNPSACTNFQADLNNCGRCGQRCPAGDSCLSGTCVTPTPTNTPTLTPTPTPTATPTACPCNAQCVDPTGFPACDTACGGAHCVPAADVQASLQGLLVSCRGGFCEPDPLISTVGNYRPPSCTAFSGTSAEGRCLSSCLPLVRSQPGLEMATCASGDRCVPCFDPFTGANTGACQIGVCDAPTLPRYTFPDCCFSQNAAQGRCVPLSQIPAAEQGSLEQDACPSATYLCVPDENLPGGTPQACSGPSPFFLSGTCLSNCLNLGPFGGLFAQGSCDNNHTCIPCSLLPPGSPGCS